MSTKTRETMEQMSELLSPCKNKSSGKYSWLQFSAFLLFDILARCSSEPQGGMLQFSDILPEDPWTYDKMQPPKKDGNPTVVNNHVTVMGLDSINEESMTYAADIFFAQSWKDHRLRLPENMTSEYRLLEVTWLKHMWRPDSFFKNAKAVNFQTMTIPNHYVWLYKDKTILYMVKLTLILSCAMNFATYPHDTQHCSLQMESLSHTTDDLVFDWQQDFPLEVNDNIELPQLDLVRTETMDCTQQYSTGNFTCLQVTFTLKRRLGFYMFHTYIPTCLIVIMSWVSFWIRPEAVPARVTLGVTSLLTLSTQHAKSQASLPPVSYIKAIDIFMSSCTIFVFLSLMEYAVVNVILEDSALRESTPTIEEEPDPKDLVTQDNFTILNLEPRKSDPSPARKRRLWAQRIDKSSRIIFPISFAALTVTYWTYYVLCI